MGAMTVGAAGRRGDRGAAGTIGGARLRARVIGRRLRVGDVANTGGAVTLVQCDATTCGAASVLAARLLVHGVGLRARPGPGPFPGKELVEALARAQRRAQGAMNRHAGGPLGPLPWPRCLGSTPWAVARALGRELGLDYRVRRAVGRQGLRPGAVADLRRVLERGWPVILLVGGPLVRPRSGDTPVTRAMSSIMAGPVPRHYVLALPWSLLGGRDPGPGRAHLYEPSSGSVGVLDLLTLWPDAAPRELGYWPSILALIEPALAGDGVRPGP